MRDPNRIDGILATLAESWKANPDMRLGQLITIGTRHGHGVDAGTFYIEDDKLERGLREQLYYAKPELRPPPPPPPDPEPAPADVFADAPPAEEKK